MPPILEIPPLVRKRHQKYKTGTLTQKTK